MFKNKSPGNRGQSTVENSLHGLASMLAFIAAFLVAPQVYDVSAQPVYEYLLRNYGDHTIATLGIYVWTFLATACVYFISRAVIVLSVMLIAQRLILFAV